MQRNRGRQHDALRITRLPCIVLTAGRKKIRPLQQLLQGVFLREDFT